MDTIPVIDIAPFRNGSREQQKAVAEEVAEACASLGFLIVSGHGVADSLIDGMREVSFAYFDRPVAEKLKLRMPPDRYRGYISLGSEALAYSLDEETPPDFKESFSIGPIRSAGRRLPPRCRSRKILCAQSLARVAVRLPPGLGGLLSRDGACREHADADFRGGPRHG